MFIVVINLQEVAKGNSFDEAFRLFYQTVKDGVKDGTIPTWQLLETACYIELRVDGRGQEVWYWAQAKEIAFSSGILTEDGKLMVAVPEIDVSIYRDNDS